MKTELEKNLALAIEGEGFVKRQRGEEDEAYKLTLIKSHLRNRSVVQYMSSHYGFAVRMKTRGKLDKGIEGKALVITPTRKQLLVLITKPEGIGEVRQLLRELQQRVLHTRLWRSEDSERRRAASSLMDEFAIPYLIDEPPHVERLL